MATWEQAWTAVDRETVAKGGWAGRVGFGERPVLVVIDVQNYMVGIRGETDEERFPLACPDGWPALEHIKALIAASRDARVPVIYTRFALDPLIDDGGVLNRKLSPPRGDGIYLEGTFGSEIVAEVAPRADEIVITKKKQSAFFGTPLQAYLSDRRIDTVIVVGGSTSNCVRATITDSAAYNYHTIVPAEAVFDRIASSHEVGLADVQRTYGDVLPSDEVVRFLRGRGQRESSGN